MDASINMIYGNKVRIRACGVCWKNGSLLMVNHANLRSGDFWAPPGGGIELGQTLEENLIREFAEETGIKVKPEKFLFMCEFIKPPLHAIEVFFEVSYVSGTTITGSDPEMTDKQIIKNVQWMTVSEIKSHPPEALHGIFKFCDQPEDITKMSGFWHIN